jgi:hypothetical protein
VGLVFEVQYGLGGIGDLLAVAGASPSVTQLLRRVVAEVVSDKVAKSVF